MKMTSTSYCRKCPGGIAFLLVLVVVGTLAFFLGAFVRERFFDRFSWGVSRLASTDAKIQQLCAAVHSYQTNGGMFPSAEQGLKALLEKPVSNPVPVRWVKLVSDSDLLDAWKVPFAYYAPARKDGGEFEIVSAGMDKMMNTEDDISSADED